VIALKLGASEGRLPRRLLKGEDRRAKLVAEPAQQVVAMLVDELLAELGAAPRDLQPGLFRPSDELPAEVDRLPRSAGRRKVPVGGAVAAVVGDRLHSAAHSHPHRRGGRQP